MATKILIDIQNDIKLLITAITGFEEGEEGFRICETFALSNVKHHRYLSVDGHATKRAIEELKRKFSIHGKYELSKKFGELIDTFLSSFDFDHHPQYDLQWSLLSFLLNLSTETNKSELQSLDALRSSRAEHSLNVTANKSENEHAEDIDWGLYLNEGLDNFFSNYRSDSDSDWSDDDLDETLNQCKSVNNQKIEKSLAIAPAECTQSSLDKISKSLADGVESKNWLKRNVQNDWWASVDCSKYFVDSKFPDADFCQLWDEITSRGIQSTGTLSEYQACREVLWMLHSPGEMVLFQEGDELQFSIKDQVSIPSLSHDAFSSILAPLSNYFEMLRELEQFGENLYPKQGFGQLPQRPPLTYEAYHRAVAQHLEKLREETIRIEKKFVEQDDCNTLLSLVNDLRTYFHGLKMLYDVHRAVTTEWEFHPSWECASKLLSGLFFEMQNSSSREKANMCASLYLQSLAVYLNIIDTWLSEGRFEDWRGEFVIAKVLEDVTLEDEEQYDKFIVRKLDTVCLNDPIMQLLLHKVRDMGRSIELLVSLDRIPDMWRMVNRSNVSRISLNDEFLSEVIAEFGKYSPKDITDGVEVLTVEIVEIADLDGIDSAIEQNIFQQMSSTNDPFLLKAFEDYVPFDVFRHIDTDVVDGRRTNDETVAKRGLDIFERLQSVSQSVLPSRRVLKTVLSRILDSRYEGASKLVKDIMVTEYSLEKHLKLMRCVYMMETGHVMNKFYQLLFTEIETNPTWSNANSLTNLLEEILSQEWPESSSRWSIIVHEVRTHQVLHAVDKITLHYAIGWPISMVLNEEALVRYNEIFRFQLKLKWALWTLDHLRFSDLEGLKSARMTDRLQHFQARRLESLRFWLIHAIGSIHAYLSGQVLQSLGFMLEKALAEADNLDTIIRVHNEYLIKVHEHCLQTAEFEDLTATINSLLEMCIHVRERWKRGAENIIPGELDTMENSYIKYHTYLALALHNAVQHKDADYYKLTPQFIICEKDEDDLDSSQDSDEPGEDYMTELSRNLLTEVAYQSLPPSGIPVPIPKPLIIREKNRIRENEGLTVQLRERLATNEYEQTFSYLRWYRYEERIKINAISSGAESLFDELDQIVKEVESEDFEHA